MTDLETAAQESDELIVQRNDAAKMYVAQQSLLWFEARRDGGRVRSKKNAVNGAFHAGFNFACAKTLKRIEELEGERTNLKASFEEISRMHESCREAQCGAQIVNLQDQLTKERQISKKLEEALVKVQGMTRYENDDDSKVVEEVFNLTYDTFIEVQKLRGAGSI